MAERRALPPPPSPTPKGVGTERKIYVLPTEQVERIRAYQTASGITSEVEAVRRLLDTALEMRDTVFDLLNKMKAHFANEKDLRVIARDVLAGHSRVTSIGYGDNEITFTLGPEQRGRMDSRGRIFVNGDYGPDDWDEVGLPPPPASRRSTHQSPAPKSDLDDDIPF